MQAALRYVRKVIALLKYLPGIESYRQEFDITANVLQICFSFFYIVGVHVGRLHLFFSFNELIFYCFPLTAGKFSKIKGNLQPILPPL